MNLRVYIYLVYVVWFVVIRLGWLPWEVNSDENLVL